MSYSEEVASFRCETSHLIGILSRPSIPLGTGVVIVVGGPQYRVGSHRQFVLLARALASAGYPVLRFDYRGMGDSEGSQRDFETVGPDIAAALDALHSRVPSVSKVVLWGLCDGASAALLYWEQTKDPRISGLCLLNPWVRSEASLARTQLRHYYTQRLRQKEFWRKLISGKVALAALSGFMRRIRLSVSGARPLALSQRPFQLRMAEGWNSFNGGVLLILSGDDYTAKEFLEYTRSHAAWQGALDRARLQRSDVPGVDHTFSSAASRKLAEELTLAWLARL
jgi:exosortase A-associated hydrolase 1